MCVKVSIIHSFVLFAISAYLFICSNIVESENVQVNRLIIVLSQSYQFEYNEHCIITHTHTHAVHTHELLTKFLHRTGHDKSTWSARLFLNFPHTLNFINSFPKQNISSYTLTQNMHVVFTLSTL